MTNNDHPDPGFLLMVIEEQERMIEIQSKALQELIRLYRMVTEDQNEKTYHYYHSSSPPDTGAG